MSRRSVRDVVAEPGRAELADTILRWYCELIARRYDGAVRRWARRPTIAIDVEQFVV